MWLRIHDEAWTDDVGDERPHFRCPDCGMVSYNLNDITNAYCGKCHRFTRDEAEEPS